MCQNLMEGDNFSGYTGYDDHYNPHYDPHAAQLAVPSQAQLAYQQQVNENVANARQKLNAYGKNILNKIPEHIQESLGYVGVPAQFLASGGDIEYKFNDNIRFRAKNTIKSDSHVRIYWNFKF